MINYIDINKIVVSNKLPFCKQDFKYFIGYEDSEKIKPLCIFRSQMIIYKRYFDESRHNHFIIKKEKIFNKYMEILEKVRSIIKNEFNSKYMYSKKYLKVGKKANTKEDFQCLYAPLILIDSIYKKDGNYYPKVFLQKYYFIEDIEICCSNSDKECINLFLETHKK